MAPNAYISVTMRFLTVNLNKVQIFCYLFSPQITTCNRCTTWSLANHITSFMVYWWLATVHLLVYAQTAEHIVVLSPCLPVKNPCDILQEWIIEKNGWPSFINKDESAAKKPTVKRVEVKFELDINGFIQEIIDHEM